jgi:glutaryl-CoA dehydrogenase
MARNPFNIDDAYLFESELSEDDKMIMETAREYAQTRLEPRALEGNQEEIFDMEIAKEMGDLGLLGATIRSQIRRCWSQPYRIRSCGP